jgi:hypothetical protein
VIFGKTLGKSRGKWNTPFPLSSFVWHLTLSKEEQLVVICEDRKAWTLAM